MPKLSRSLFYKLIVSSICLSLLYSTFSSAQNNESDAFQNWDVNAPPMKLNTVTINTDETTWSSLAITPNGKQFVFDMLGDIFIVDIKGGKAKALTQDFAWNLHPAVSPDGTQIAFISDRDGLSNVWVMDMNGKNLRQVTKEQNNVIHAPSWSPDGEYIVVMKGIYLWYWRCSRAYPLP